MGWYLAAVSVIAAVVTGYDKWAAKHRTDRRIPEKTLFFLAAIGGSAAMLAVMLLIRHKTRHLSFMLGLPLLMILQFLILHAVS